MLLRNQVNQLTKCCSISATFFYFQYFFVASVLQLLNVQYTAQNSVLFHIKCNILHNINRHSVSYHTAFIHFAKLSSFTCMIWFTFNDFHAPAISYHESKAIIHLVTRWKKRTHHEKRHHFNLGCYQEAVDLLSPYTTVTAFSRSTETNITQLN
jgi:hypothetical protein